MRHDRDKRPRPPLDAEALERLGLAYAGRYATTRAKLAAYLARKVRERGWDGAGEPPIGSLVERFAALGYVDDRAFAEARAGALLRRGYGECRVEQALRAAGVGEDEGGPARVRAREDAWAAAWRCAERRRLGPWGAGKPARAGRERGLGGRIRAGHGMAMGRRRIDSTRGVIPESDD